MQRSPSDIEVSSGSSSDGSDSKDVKVGESGIVLNTKKKATRRMVGEEEWSTAAEKLISDWAVDCDARAKTHNEKKKMNGWLHAVFGLPSILLPVVMAAMTPIIDESPHAVAVQVGGLVCIGALGTINTFFNFKSESSRHAEFASRFSELHSDVKYQLYKSREFRVPSDEFIARVQTKFDSLVERAP